MRRTKHVLFSFPPYMYKAVERYINAQAAKGWELEKVGRFGYLAKFRRTHSTDLRYGTDLIPYRRGKKGRAKVEEYLALCREGGWDQVDRRNSLFWVLLPLLTDLIYWFFLLWTGWRTGGDEWVNGIPEHLLFSWYHSWIVVAFGAVLPLLALPALLRLGGRGLAGGLDRRRAAWRRGPGAHRPAGHRGPVSVRPHGADESGCAAGVPGAAGRIRRGESR